MKYQVNEPEFMRKAEANGVAADMVDDLEGAEVRFSKFTGRLHSLDILGQ